MTAEGFRQGPIPVTPKDVQQPRLSLTELHAGGKFESTVYKISGGLHGVGISVVNALSEWLEVEIKQNGQVFQQRFERGTPAGPLTSCRQDKGKGHKGDLQAGQ